MIEVDILKDRDLKTFSLNGVRVIYHDGVSFDCLPEWECYECCKTPADLNEREYKNLLNLGYSNFAYKIAHGIYKLRKKDDACIFLKDNKCEIHEHKPLSCRAQPFVPIYFDFHAANLVVAIEPNAYRWCYGLQEGDMQESKLELMSKVCKELFLDRVEYYRHFKDMREAFLIAALSIPEKVGLIATNPIKSLCFCCGFPLKVTEDYEIYFKHLARRYTVYEDVIICEKCIEKVGEMNEENILSLRDSIFFNQKLFNFF